MSIQTTMKLLYIHSGDLRRSMSYAMSAKDHTPNGAADTVFSEDHILTQYYQCYSRLKRVFVLAVQTMLSCPK